MSTGNDKIDENTAELSKNQKNSQEFFKKTNNPYLRTNCPAIGSTQPTFQQYHRIQPNCQPPTFPCYRYGSRRQCAALHRLRELVDSKFAFHHPAYGMQTPSIHQQWTVQQSLGHCMARLCADHTKPANHLVRPLRTRQRSKSPTQCHS